MARLQMPILEMNSSSDHEWLDWLAVQKKALRLRTRGCLAEALAEINVFLDLEQPSDLRCDALAFRAMIEEEQGELVLAKTDRQCARALALPASYRRYTIELGLAGLGVVAGRQAVSVVFQASLITAGSRPIPSRQVWASGAGVYLLRIHPAATP